MALDTVRDVIVLFGGITEGFVQSNETWEWNGATWSLRSTGGPSPRRFHAMVYDQSRGVTVLFGGLIDSPELYSGETWEWNGNAWQLRSTTGPIPRVGHSMIYDPVRGTVILFGGFNINNGRTQGDTWEWDGANWVLLSTNDALRRAYASFNYDSDSNAGVLFGGSGDLLPEEFEDTWNWSAGGWTQASTAGPSRKSHAASYDQGRQRLVVFGGQTDPNYPGDSIILGDTWEWDGLSWERRLLSGPSPRDSAAMEYFPTTGTVILFGGHRIQLDGNGGIEFLFFDDTWEYGIGSIAGDIDGNGFVDGEDFVLFATCLSGPNQAALCSEPTGIRSDLSHDGDVDLEDFAQLQALLGD